MLELRVIQVVGMLCVWSCWNLRNSLIAQASNYLLDKPVHSLNRTQVLEHLRALVLSLFRVWLIRKGFTRKIVVLSSLNLPFMRGLYHSVTSIKDAQNLPRHFSRLGSRTPTLRSADSQFVEVEFRPKTSWSTSSPQERGITVRNGPYNRFPTGMGRCNYWPQSVDGDPCPDHTSRDCVGLLCPSMLWKWNTSLLMNVQCDVFGRDQLVSIV